MVVPWGRGFAASLAPCCGAVARLPFCRRYGYLLRSSLACCPRDILFVCGALSVSPKRKKNMRKPCEAGPSSGPRPVVGRGPRLRLRRLTVAFAVVCHSFLDVFCARGCVERGGITGAVCSRRSGLWPESGPIPARSAAFWRLSVSVRIS